MFSFKDFLLLAFICKADAANVGEMPWHFVAVNLESKEDKRGENEPVGRLLSLAGLQLAHL